MTTTTDLRIDLDKFEVMLLEDGIIENFIKPMKHVDLVDIVQLKEANKSLANGKPYTVLVVSGHLASISKEAKELTASKEFAQNTIAKALICDSLGSKLVVNLYLKINKPYILTKSFTNKNEAVNWLRSHLKSS